MASACAVRKGLLVTQQGSLEQIARELGQLLLVHAKLCSTTPDEASMIVPMDQRIQRLVHAYGDKLFDVSGWSNPLREPEGVDNREFAAEKEGVVGRADTPPSVSAGGAERPWVSVLENHAVFVNDENVLLQYAESRSGAKPQGVMDAIRVLCELDGWKPGSYPGGIIEVDWQALDLCLG
jgi:hypothetical protein